MYTRFPLAQASLLSYYQGMVLFIYSMKPEFSYTYLPIMVLKNTYFKTSLTLFLGLGQMVASRALYKLTLPPYVPYNFSSIKFFRFYQLLAYSPSVLY